MRTLKEIRKEAKDKQVGLESLLIVNLLKDILEKLEEIRHCLVDVESAINPR